MSDSKCLSILMCLIVAVMMPAIYLYTGHQAYGTMPSSSQMLARQTLVEATGATLTPYQVVYTGDPANGWQGLYQGATAMPQVWYDLIGGSPRGIYNPNNNGLPYNIMFISGFGALISWVSLMITALKLILIS